jgi:hypothetical protein
MRDLSSFKSLFERSLRVLWIVSMIILAPIDIKAQKEDLKIALKNIQLRSAVVGKVQYQTTGRSYETNGGGFCAIPIDLRQSIPETRLTIIPPEPYIQREVPVTAKWIKSGTAIPWVLYVGKPSPIYNYQYLGMGIEYLDRGEFDRALAYYEIPYMAESGGEHVTEYSVKLEYNYARALANTCMKLGYDTCADARKLYVKLQEYAVTYSKIFGRVIKNSQELQKTLRDIELHELNNDYALFKDALYEGEPPVAVDLVENLLERYETNPDIFKSAGLDKALLERDLAFARTRASRMGVMRQGR